MNCMVLKHADFNSKYSDIRLSSFSKLLGTLSPATRGVPIKSGLFGESKDDASEFNNASSFILKTLLNLITSIRFAFFGIFFFLFLFFFSTIPLFSSELVGPVRGTVHVHIQAHIQPHQIKIKILILFLRCNNENRLNAGIVVSNVSFKKVDRKMQTWK